MRRAPHLATILLLGPLLSACGATTPSNQAPPPTELPPTVPVSSLVADDANRYVPKWEEPSRANALLRRTVLGLVVAVQSKDEEKIRPYLTADAFAELEKGCGTTPLGECITPLPSFFIEAITLDDETHATISTKRIAENGDFSPGFDLHAELTADGPKLTSLPQ